MRLTLLVSGSVQVVIHCFIEFFSPWMQSGCREEAEQLDKIKMASKDKIYVLPYERLEPASEGKYVIL